MPPGSEYSETWNLFPLFTLNETFIKRTPKKSLKKSFLFQIPLPNMPDTGNAKDYLELPPTNFRFLHWKAWIDELIWLVSQYSIVFSRCFLFRFVWIELVSLIWFLQIWVAIYVYGTMINWSTLIKKLMQTYIVKVSGSILNISTVHLNGIWHLIWRYLSKP